MLKPNSRSLYTEALTPPPGYEFDEAIGTTFSMDPSVLLTVPLHLALMGEEGESDLSDGIAVLEALRRVAERITVYAQQGRVLIPDQPHVLYSLLEDVTVEVQPPGSGVFHPKMWLLRFRSNGDSQPLFRLMVLTRNISRDRSWDVSLTLEGKATDSNLDTNGELASLFDKLPGLATEELSSLRKEQAQRLADQLRTVSWELPKGFDEMRFHHRGFSSDPMRLPSSERAAVVSPFCEEAAIRRLGDNTERLDALVTRPQTLFGLSLETQHTFGKLFTLHEAIERDESETASPDTLGLHAKLFMIESGAKTHLFVGSANATNAALLSSANVEVMAELIGDTARVGGIDAFFGEDGMLDVLEEVQPSEASEEDDASKLEADEALSTARERLCAAVNHGDLTLYCRPDDDGRWSLELHGAELGVGGIARARAWPITVQSDLSREIDAGGKSKLSFDSLAASSLTRFIAFELEAEAAPVSLRFVLKVGAPDGMPQARRDDIVRTVVRNREGFLRYLLLLLGDETDVADRLLRKRRYSQARKQSSNLHGLPLLEDLARTYARHPERLTEIDGVIERLVGAGDKDSPVPPEFLRLWQVFRHAQRSTDER